MERSGLASRGTIGRAGTGRRPTGAARNGMATAFEYSVPRSAPNAPMEIAKKQALTATRAQRPIILRAAPPVTAQLARAICSLMANLFVCRCEEDGQAVLQGNFSTGKCVTTVVRKRHFRNSQT